MDGDSVVETALYHWCAEWLARFLQMNSDETYYGLVMECNPFDPGFHLRLGCETPKHASHPNMSAVEVRRNPEFWCYDSMDCDDFTERLHATYLDGWLDGFAGQLSAGDAEQMRKRFEAFVEGATRAMLRVEREFVSDSERFTQPAECFVVFEEEDLEDARRRYAVLKSGGSLEPDWSKSIYGMS